MRRRSGHGRERALSAFRAHADDQDGTRLSTDVAAVPRRLVDAL